MNNQNESCTSTKCCSCANRLWIVLGILGAFMTGYGIFIVVFSHRITTIPEHHLLHAGMVVGTSLLALALARFLPKTDRERTWWTIPAILAPALSLFLMWPSLYTYMMSRPALHVLDHVGIAFLSLLAVFAAQAYTRGLGWVMMVLIIGMNVGAAGGFGSSPKSNGAMDMSSMDMSHDSQAAEAALALKNSPMHIQGKTFAQNLGCTACHSADGTKSIGPSWKNLAGYPQKMADGSSAIADYAFIKKAILNPGDLHLEGYPAGVMPASYREMLSGPGHEDEHDLNAIIWYINSLSDKSDASTQPPVPDAPKATSAEEKTPHEKMLENAPPDLIQQMEKQSGMH